jgi:hypothetical protein
VLPQIISDSQSDFIPGWLITDNIAMAYELMHSMNKKKNEREDRDMAMKLDMSKVYDQVKCIFLCVAMKKWVLL